MCRKYFDFVDELDHGILQKEDQQIKYFNKIPQSPHLLCKINNFNTWALIGSSSQITAVSEGFMKR